MQMIEQTKRQQELDIKKLPVDDELSLSNEERGEVEYEIYYALIKERQPDLFELNGDCKDIFSWGQDKRLFQIFQNNGQFYGVYKQEFKEAHKVTEVFHSKEEVLLNTFGTSKFERFRGHVLFLSKDGKAFSLQNSQQFRLNLMKPFKAQAFYENIEQARSFIVKDELKKEPKIRIQALRRTLEEYYIPSDFVGKTITLNSISKDNEGVRISFEENEIEQNIRIPNLDEKWLGKIRDNPRMNVAFDELIMDSCSIGEGFLAFYDLEIKKELQIRQQDFEVVSDEEGSYIGKLSATGGVKKISPYFSEKEANEQLEKLNHYIQLEKQKDRYKEKEVEPSIEFMELSEKD
ncbi:hypothetical protein J7E63_14905 [Bacillus sp. ISL-75]|uniref:hypothetical protein n=1 Tax=Bacillus sp. ISL-75 TaxID=2819137 RepID=UPI001BE525AE|nr:hypothetical protein [Bacillus sp. ISL-75]MBT2728227.1 hypothetical protein [Bacillus sp. ISL-75]